MDALAREERPLNRAFVWSSVGPRPNCPTQLSLYLTHVLVGAGVEAATQRVLTQYRASRKALAARHGVANLAVSSPRVEIIGRSLAKGPVLELAGIDKIQNLEPGISLIVRGR